MLSRIVCKTLDSEAQCREVNERKQIGSFRKPKCTKKVSFCISQQEDYYIEEVDAKEFQGRKIYYTKKEAYLTDKKEATKHSWRVNISAGVNEERRKLVASKISMKN